MVAVSSLPEGPDSDSRRPLVDGPMLPDLEGETFPISARKLVRYIDETIVVGPRRMGPAADMPATPVHMDAGAVLLGRNSERISRDTKYLAARYAMIRDAELTGDIRFDVIGTDEIAAEIFTKPLCERKFRYMLAKVLGHYNADGSLDL